MVRYSTKIRKNYESKINIVCLLILLIACLSSPVFISSNAFDARAEGEKSGYIVIEATSQRVLKEFNSHQPMPMASTTKIMTALIVLEKANIDDVVNIPKEAVGVDGSSIYLKNGDKMSVKDLLYGLMLRSGNDAATALAIHTAGSLENFVALMNQRAQSLGLKNTRFQNPHGLSAKNHYTSAYDLAIITSEAFKNTTFKEIVSTKMHTVKAKSNDENRYFANKNRILYSYDGANGVKTGYTMEAGRCLVASSERDGMQVIAVALNYYDYFELCASLMDYAHSQYRMEKVIDAEKCYRSVEVQKGRRIKSTELHALENAFYPLKADGSEQIREEISSLEQIIAPHSKENSCGELKIYVGNDLIFNEKLYTIYNIEKKSLFDFLR